MTVYLLADVSVGLTDYDSLGELVVFVIANELDLASVRAQLQLYSQSVTAAAVVHLLTHWYLIARCNAVYTFSCSQI